MIPVNRRRILLVEDHYESAKTLAECLPCFDVFSASTFKEATQKLFSQGDKRYSAIILDLRLPDGAGPGLAGRLHSVWPEIPIVVITGMSQEEAPTVTVHRAGAERVLRKPVDVDDLRETLIDVIADKEAKQQTAAVTAKADTAKAFMQSALDSAIGIRPQNPKSDPPK